MSFSVRYKHLIYTFSLLVSLLLCTTQAGLAQEGYISPATLNEIKASTYSPTSPYYYPPLLERYEANDTTLTLDDYRYLYLGYSYQEEYNPYHVNAYAEQLRDIVQRVEMDREAECDTIIKYAAQAVADFPFDIRNINILVYAYRCKGMDRERDLWSFKLQRLIDTILSTGDGKSPESAWYIINTAHEYDIINRLGLTATEQHIANDHYDYLRVEKNEFDITGYYFNVLRLSQEYARKYSTYK